MNRINSVIVEIIILYSFKIRNLTETLNKYVRFPVQ